MHLHKAAGTGYAGFGGEAGSIIRGKSRVRSFLRAANRRASASGGAAAVSNRPEGSICFLGALALFMLLVPAFCFAQESRGTLAGRVIDSTGAVLCISLLNHSTSHDTIPSAERVGVRRNLCQRSSQDESRPVRPVGDERKLLWRYS